MYQYVNLFIYIYIYIYCVFIGISRWEKNATESNTISAKSMYIIDSKKYSIRNDKHAFGRNAINSIAFFSQCCYLLLFSI